jgi:hypothetical protein
VSRNRQFTRHGSTTYDHAGGTQGSGLPHRVLVKATREGFGWFTRARHRHLCGSGSRGSAWCGHFDMPRPHCGVGA